MARRRGGLGLATCALFIGTVWLLFGDRQPDSRSQAWLPLPSCTQESVSLCLRRPSSIAGSVLPGGLADWRGGGGQEERRWQSAAQLLPGVRSARTRLQAAKKEEKKDKALDDLRDMARMKADMKMMGAAPRPRGGKRVGGEIWFDIELNLPMGLRIDDAPGEPKMVGVSEVVDGGSASAHNAAVMGEEAKDQNFIQPGDRLLEVNGVKVSSQAEVVELLSSSKTGTARLKLARNSRGMITVVFPEPAVPVTVPPRMELSAAAMRANHPVDYNCEDGFCGSCWHFNEKTGEVYKLCADGQQVCEVPSKASQQLTGFVDALVGKEGTITTWDNTEPLVLTRCPEIFDYIMDPFVGEWQYVGGMYRIVRGMGENPADLYYTENNVTGVLRDDEAKEWLVAELPPHGTIRLRRGTGLSVSTNMESQFKEAGSHDWGEMKTAFQVSGGSWSREELRKVSKSAAR